MELSLAKVRGKNHLYEIGKFWVVDYRIYDPDRDGKTHIDHVMEMLQNLVYHKTL